MRRKCFGGHFRSADTWSSVLRFRQNFGNVMVASEIDPPQSTKGLAEKLLAHCEEAISICSVGQHVATVREATQQKLPRTRSLRSAAALI